MINKDKKSFAVMLAMMHEVFTPDRIMSEDQQELRARTYFKFLEDLPIQAIEKSVEEIVKNRRTTYPPYPTVAEIRGKVFGDKENMDEEGLAAWNDIRKIYRRIVDNQCENGPELNLNEREKIINEAVIVAFGSWDKYHRGIDNEHFDRLHFVKCYRLVKMKWIQENLLLLEEGKEVKQLGVR